MQTIPLKLFFRYIQFTLVICNLFELSIFLYFSISRVSIDLLCFKFYDSEITSSPLSRAILNTGYSQGVGIFRGRRTIFRSSRGTVILKRSRNHRVFMVRTESQKSVSCCVFERRARGDIAARNVYAPVVLSGGSCFFFFQFGFFSFCFFSGVATVFSLKVSCIYSRYG